MKPQKNGGPPSPEISPWVLAGLEELSEAFEQAKASEDTAHELMTAEERHVEAQSKLLKELKARHAPVGEIQAAQRDLAVWQARFTAAATLWLEMPREGRDVDELSPLGIVSAIAENQRGGIFTALFGEDEPAAKKAG